MRSTRFSFTALPHLAERGILPGAADRLSAPKTQDEPRHRVTVTSRNLRDPSRVVGEKPSITFRITPGGGAVRYRDGEMSFEPASIVGAAILAEEV